MSFCRLAPAFGAKCPTPPSCRYATGIYNLQFNTSYSSITDKYAEITYCLTVGFGSQRKLNPKSATTFILSRKCGIVAVFSKAWSAGISQVLHCLYISNGKKMELYGLLQGDLFRKDCVQVVENIFPFKFSLTQ